MAVAHQVPLVLGVFLFWCLAGPQCWMSWACCEPPHHTSGAAPAHCGSAQPSQVFSQADLGSDLAQNLVGRAVAVPWQDFVPLAVPWNIPIRL